MSHAAHKSSPAKLAATFRVPHSSNDEAIFNFLSALDCPRSLTVWLLYSNKEADQLVELDCNPSDFNSSDGFRDAYLATTFLSKANFLDTSVSRRDSALRKFLKFEDQCKHTNNRFRQLGSDPLFQGLNASLLHGVTRKISAVLGTSIGCEEFVDRANWGPGVSTLIKGSHVSAVNKFQSETGITRDLYTFISPWFSSAYPLWADHLESEVGPELFTIEMGNEVVTVPKNSKTDRVIAIEPGLNLWFQKALGSAIRSRLSREGINLNSQERNQQGASIGSSDGSLATVDFSSASDSISTELIREVIPPEWFRLLDLSRSKIGSLDGKSFVWNKFSSMGNGFTFELESLVFYAAAWSVCEHLKLPCETISVFGDDVIIPVEAFHLFSSFCAFLGFTVNKQKSFSSGYFRESCGSHYYDGRCCKPFYLKEKIQNVQDVYKLANGVRRLAHRECDYRACARRWLHCFSSLRRRVPRCLQLEIPDGVGDGGFISNWDEAAPPVCAPHGYEGYLVKCLLELGLKSEHFESTGLLLARLWRCSTEECGNTYTLRGRTKLRVSRILVPRWYLLGPWI